MMTTELAIMDCPYGGPKGVIKIDGKHRICSLASDVTSEDPYHWAGEWSIGGMRRGGCPRPVYYGPDLRPYGFSTRDLISLGLIGKYDCPECPYILGRWTTAEA